MTRFSRAILVTATLCRLLGVTADVRSAEPVEFRRDVAPILARHCLRCHNERDRRGGLSLASEESTRRGGDSGVVVVPNDADSSYLLDLVTPADGKAEMPQGAEPLKPEEIATLRRWIADGASWPADLVLTPPKLWSLAPLQRPDVPAEVETPSAFPIRTPIDAFIAARHHEAGLTPAPPASRRTLIRRLSLDLTGLPPSPKEVDAFVADPDPLAYERLVDHLLDSPHFGEHWGRHWLDLARYGDSDGYLGDNLRPHAWVYREWVIDAINGDLPFDQFTIEQLAGDLLENPTLEQKIATGFHRHTLRNTEAGVDLELYRTKEIVDRVSTTGMVWLGLTLGCAECHDHKNDPILQREFYQLYAFFNNADEVGITATKPWEVAEYQHSLGRWRSEWNKLVADLEAFEVDGLTEERKAKIAETLSTDGKSLELKAIEGFYRTDESGWRALRRSLEAHFKQKPARPSTKAPVFAERTNDRRQTFIHIRGVYNRPGNKVGPGTPSILPELKWRGPRPDRLDLARWLFDEDNPLTARVAANRVWGYLFGQGIVTTPNDFGTQGAKPTHPLLLDWLASEYRRLGWSRKALVRLIVTSSTYRLSSASNAVADQQDAGNQLLWRQNSYRVNAETVRDLHLAASGLLDRTIGRKGIRPPLPSFITEVGRSVKWPESEGSERYRRGMYIVFKRTVPYPMLMAFDAPDSTISCSRRERSNTPLQALTLLNDPVFYECAQELGRQISEQHSDDSSAAFDELFMRCLGRRPTAEELSNLESAYADLCRLADRSHDEANRVEKTTDAAMVAMARIVMNLDEFITRD